MVFWGTQQGKSNTLKKQKKKNTKLVVKTMVQKLTLPEVKICKSKERWVLLKVIKLTSRKEQSTETNPYKEIL